jgi:hypothetical protein
MGEAKTFPLTGAKTDLEVWSAPRRLGNCPIETTAIGLLPRPHFAGLRRYGRLNIQPTRFKTLGDPHEALRRASLPRQAFYRRGD